MDYRCPACSTNLGRQKFSQTVMGGLEVECPRCKSVIRLNLHPAETAIIMLNFAAIVVLAAFAYWLQSRGLALAAVGAGFVGTSALPLLERTWWRNWPRYAPMAPKQSPN